MEAGKRHCPRLPLHLQYYSTAMQTLTHSTTAPNLFPELRQRVIAAGLLTRQPLYYMWKLSCTAALLLGGIVMLFLLRESWWVLLIAPYLAFVFGQVGLIGHDAGHRQIFASTGLNDCMGYLNTLCLGMSFTGWRAIHNAHHASPNRDEADPDIDFPFLAYCEEQALRKRGALPRFIIRHQAWFYFPILTFTALSLRNTGILHFLRSPLRETWLDQLLFALHFMLYVGGLLWLLPWTHALLFIVLHQLLWGLYLGSIFAPNHKGMPVLDRETNTDFLHEQVLTARNIRSNPLINFWYGGLNFQIEHHLFPAMPRNNLCRVQPLVKATCMQHGIPYHETGLLTSYWEILSHMHEIGASLRESSPLSR